MLTEAEKPLLDAAAELPVDDLSSEIDVMRARLARAIEVEPDALAIMLRGMGVLAGLARTQYMLSDEQTDGLLVGMASILREYQLAMGSMDDDELMLTEAE